ncbi:MAG: hypothetical protein LKM36_12350 [Flavobacteriales bacterium]|jgi:hypothetical protein|nr:hypothetical protein [Flavobacteriales bacterium]
MSNSEGGSESIQIQFQLDEVRNRFLRQLRVSTESLTHAYHALNSYRAEFLPVLEIDSLPFIVQDPQIVRSWDTLKKQTMNWLLKNAFEDFISGTNESLIEAYKFLHLRNLARKTRNQPFLDKPSLEGRLRQIEAHPMGMHVPALVQAIEKELGGPLQMTTEILSINKVRNCLVHRNGLVTALDVNYKDANCLRLLYIDHIVHVKIDGHIHRLTRELKEQSPMVHGMQLEAKPTIRDYAIGDLVSFDANLFNSVSYTCLCFTELMLQQLWKLVEQDRAQES